MSFRTILGKLFLTDKDRQTIENDLRVVERYTEEVLEQERRIEEERKAAEAREAARKAEEARLAAIRKAEEERRAKKRAEEKDSSHYSGPKYSILSDTGRYSLDIQDAEPADLFGYNSPYGIDDILTNPGIRKTMQRDMTFAEKMSQLMSKYGMSSADVYKAGNVDKSLFSKLLSNPEYKPSRDTAISIALALKLSLEEAEDLIGRAGFTLSHAMHRDIVLECCFKKRIFNVIEVNIILDRLGHKPLSRIPS